MFRSVFRSLSHPLIKLYVPPAPPPPEPSKIQEIVKYVPPVVVDSILPFEPKPVTTDQILAQSTIDSDAFTANGNGDDMMMGQDGFGSDEPFYLVEVMPSFKGGGISEFRNWVMRRTNYPQEAVDKKIHGTVYLTFIVEKDGSVSNVTIVKGS